MSNDAQFGLARILRPFANFETAYQGVTSSRPIMFTEGGKALDSQAGHPGYDPLLLNGLSVPFGARVLIWFTRVTGLTGISPFDSSFPYIWQLSWRLRNVFDYQQNRTPYQLGQSQPGVPDAGSPRVVLPVATETIIYSQTPEPTYPTQPVSNLRSDTLRTEIGSAAVPFVDPAAVNTGVYQQGVFDPVVDAGIADQPLFGPYDTHAKGNELLLSVRRNPDPASGGGAAQPNWDFAGGLAVDHVFSQLFGNGQGQVFPNIGIYVMTGTAP